MLYATSAQCTYLKLAADDVDLNYIRTDELFSFWAYAQYFLDRLLEKITEEVLSIFSHQHISSVNWTIEVFFSICVRMINGIKFMW